LAVAGPVSNNEVTMTNRGRWVINGEQVCMWERRGEGGRVEGTVSVVASVGREKARRIEERREKD
jgi:hypothetical protein